MNFRYEDYIRRALYELKSDDYEIEIDEEQAFLKIKDLKPNTIYVILKYLNNDKEDGAETQPIQFMILSEQNKMESARELFKAFASAYNWKVEFYQYTDDQGTHTEYVKQQYTDPVVLSNFNPVTFGYRSVLYMSANLYLLDKVVDLRDLKINNVSIKALTFAISYSMTPNTQQKPTEFIASSVKSVSSISIAMSTPMVENNVIQSILAIMNETDTQVSTENTYGGNEDFTFDFYIGQIHFVSKAMRLISAQLNTSINAIPAIHVLLE